MKKILLFFLLLTGFSQAQTTCTATASGDWLTPGIWSCGHTPTCGDLVIIPSAITVSVNSQVDLSGCNTAACDGNCTGTCAATGIDLYIATGGYLKFKNGNKLKLPCCSHIVSAPGATIQPGSGGGSSNYIEICTDKVWTSDSGNVVGTNCFPKPCNPLPVEFIGFTGNLEVKVVFLKWTTASESNNLHFVVEKSSDGLNFYSIGKEKSKGFMGNSSVALNYDFIDNDLKHPRYYYRLKQVDLNGSYKYSKTISVKIYAPELAIYPNPNDGKFWIDVPTALTKQPINLSLFNELGEAIINEEYIVENDNITGAKVEILPKKPLAKGVYFAKILFNGEPYFLKLVVN
ncbi:MAG: T9SS type A sorting domain-containing protein [Bacteroidia bacterium]